MGKTCFFSDVSHRIQFNSKRNRSYTGIIHVFVTWIGFSEKRTLNSTLITETSYSLSMNSKLIVHFLSIAINDFKPSKKISGKRPSCSKNAADQQKIENRLSKTISNTFLHVPTQFSNGATRYFSKIERKLTRQVCIPFTASEYLLFPSFNLQKVGKYVQTHTKL